VPYNGDKRYIRRDERSRIKKGDAGARPLAQDRPKRAKVRATPSQGARGDRPRAGRAH
jgi:hypothetical protein